MTGRPKPMPFQKEGVWFMEEHNGRALLADEQGLGKTLQVLWYIQRNIYPRPVVVVCPAVAKYVWEKEARKLGIFSLLLEGRKPARGQRPSLMGTSLIIINYDILRGWWRWLKRLNPACLVLDECHYIQNLEAQRTKCVLLLAKGIKHVIAASGTPITNRPYEFFPVLHLLWPKRFNSLTRFAWAHCKPEKKPWGKWEFKGAVNIDKLHRKVTRLGMIRRMKADVLPQLPPMTQEVVPLKINNMREYTYAASHFLDWLETKSTARARRAAKAEAMTRIFYLLQLAAKGKMREVVRWVDEYRETTGYKFVLMAHHTKAISALRRWYGDSCVVVDGNVTGSKRELAVTTFQTDPRCTMFIGNLKAASVATTLTAGRAVGIAEFPWSPATIGQAIARICRIGQDYPTWAYYFVGHGTIEEDLCETLQEKQVNINHLLNGEAGTDTLDIYDMLIERLAKR